MRKLMIAVLPFVFACAKGEEAPADSMAMAAAPGLTEADFAGTWTGTATAPGDTAVVGHWSITCGAGTCRLTTTENPKDTVVSTYTLVADSAMGTSQPYANSQMNGTMVTEKWAGKVTGNQITGTGQAMLAAKPDSVVQRFVFTGMKNP